MIPLITPGRESGSVTLRKVWTGSAPRSALASSREWSILVSDVCTCRIMKGRKL